MSNKLKKLTNVLSILTLSSLLMGNVAYPIDAETLLEQAPTQSEALLTEKIMLQKLEKARSIRQELREIRTFPLYFQTDYPDVAYGDYGTVYSHGCGITCLAMVSSYLTGEEYRPDTLAEQFGKYNSECGSLWQLFEDSAEILELPLQERTFKWEDAKKALENGQVVISLQVESVFSNFGHFIVLTGITEDGKITVNDPYEPNYTKNEILIDGFANGFSEQYVVSNGYPYWIYDKKPVTERETKLINELNNLLN